MFFRFSLFHPNRLRTECISEQKFEGTQAAAEAELKALIARGEASLGQVLREDGLVLCTHAAQAA